MSWSVVLRTPKTALSTAAIFAALTISSVAPADEPRGFPACKEGKARSESDALAFYRVGKSRYDAKEFDDAIRLFLEAYSADCTRHELLLILSKAYESQNERLNAASALETYLTRVPADAETNARRLKIAQLRHTVTRAKEDPTTPVAVEAPKVHVERPGPPPENRQVTPQTLPPPSPMMTALPWIVAGTGVVMLGTGINLYLVGRSNVPAGCDFSAKTCDLSSTAEQRDKAGTARGLALGGIVTGVVGLATLGGGIAWALTQKPAEARTASGSAERSTTSTQLRMVVTPLLGDSGGVVTASKNF